MSSSDPRFCQRHRGLYALLVVVIICAGLALRSETLAFPVFLAKYGGDALWALMFFVGFGFLFPAWSTAAVAGLALALTCTIEVSQLYHAPWIDTLRDTWYGRLTLGSSFAWADIAAYLTGIVPGAALEWGICKVRRAATLPRSSPGASPDS
jgi:hypothetical protein